MTRFFVLLITLLVGTVFVTLPLSARNVPGSSSKVQGYSDIHMSSSIADLAIAPIGSLCENDVFRNADPASGNRRDDCTWGFSMRGEHVELTGNPSGYKFDTVANIAASMISYQLNADTSIVGGVLFEIGDTKTAFNNGKTDFLGYGGSVGIVHSVSREMRLILMGTGELLNYDVARSNGQFTGSYDAKRFIIDAALSGETGEDALWLQYRGGLRYIRQNNDSYVENDGGIPGVLVSGFNSSSLLAVSDFKLGTTIDSLRPFIEVSAMANLNDNSNTAIPGLTAENDVFNGRVGIGVDTEVAGGAMLFKSGIRFGEHGYHGFDVQLGYTHNF